MLVILDLLSTVSFACTDVLLASRNARGYLGILVSAMLTATGGGTVREFLLRSDGIFWLENYTYLLAVGVAMPLAILVNRMPHKPNYLSSVLDSIATGVFILVGGNRRARCRLQYVVRYPDGCVNRYRWWSSPRCTARKEIHPVS